MSLAREELLACCGSTAWAEAMVGVPSEELVERGRELWWSLTPDDWREAFAAHPRIGDRPTGGTQEAREQSSMDDAEAEVRELIAEGNRAYEDKYGMTYIVRAAGRSPLEMLGLLTDRLDSDLGTELVEAAAQQWEITELRLAARLSP